MLQLVKIDFIYFQYQSYEPFLCFIHFSRCERTFYLTLNLLLLLSLLALFPQHEHSLSIVKFVKLFFLFCRRKCLIEKLCLLWLMLVWQAITSNLVAVHQNRLRPSLYKQSLKLFHVFLNTRLNSNRRINLSLKACIKVSLGSFTIRIIARFKIICTISHHIGILIIVEQTFMGVSLNKFGQQLA